MKDTILASEKALSNWLSGEECKAWDNDNAFDGVIEITTFKTASFKLGEPVKAKFEVYNED